MKKLIPSFFGAILFYTIIPLPSFFPISFYKIARWLPSVGICIGILLALLAYILDLIGFPSPTKSVLIVGFWIYLTGGLHLDGVIDTADGLAVENPLQRLNVMTDSRVGAFGVISGIILIMLKIVSIGDISQILWFYLIISASYARWGQFMAIALYPYLKPEGKGAFLQKDLNLRIDIIFSSFFSIILSLYQYFCLNQSITMIISILLVGTIIPLLIGYWLKSQLGGHTGDTYGATVEWSEALILSVLTLPTFSS